MDYTHIYIASVHFFVLIVPVFFFLILVLFLGLISVNFIILESGLLEKFLICSDLLIFWKGIFFSPFIEFLNRKE